ncbi:hypothetical protein CHLRE_17g742800v5 [Chlamydomonas reinhardtii]|uniref:Retrotransposon gag domain-containing protein n=1 Tax=Chlamydomonas reinhardtii TaxID=3055 RepID=A0A2K3CRV6_CHLRE|nr:uncharacterized protein CHLRE_17g742800v5 [Chlamydomonas reinhardtii]PNW71014.1 hypothetical protein CHLRE_17g742800v5 [Chlamydomonas reinhardtii]
MSLNVNREPPPPGTEGSDGAGEGTGLPGSSTVIAQHDTTTSGAAYLLAQLQHTLQQFTLSFASSLGLSAAPTVPPTRLTPILPPRTLAADLDAAAVVDTGAAGGANEAAGGSAGRAAAAGAGEAAEATAQLAAANLNGDASPPVGGSVPGASDGERDGETGSRGIKVPISPPELNVDGLKSQQQILRARAFLRDLKRYFAVAEWGSKDEARCIYISGALKGSAKTWYDDWSLSVGDSFTSDQLLLAIRDRFAPAILTLSEEARNKLSMRRYAMRDKEAVAAYLTRFNALVAPIHDITPSERIFWFRTGLTEKLAGKCARDTNGQPFTSFDALVQHALNAESKKAAGAFAAASSLRLHYTQATDDANVEEGEDDPNPAKRQKRSDGAGPSAAVAEVADGSLPCPPRASEETKFGVSEETLQERKKAGVCFVCGKSGHGVKAHVGYSGWTKVVRKGGPGGRGGGRGNGQGRGGKGGRGGAAGKSGKPGKSGRN